MLWLPVFSASVYADIVIPAPHPFAGEHRLTTFTAFGWQTFLNVSRAMVTLTTLEQSMLLCSGNLSGVRGKVVASVFPPATTANPSDGVVSSSGIPGCAFELMISNCELAGCSGFVRLMDKHYNSVEDAIYNSELLLQYWFRCRNCSFLNPQRPAIMFPVATAEIGHAVLPLLYSMLQQGGNSTLLFPEVVVAMTSSESQWHFITRTYGVAFQVVFSLWSALNASLAVLLIFAQLKNGTVLPLLAILVLSLELVANILRFVFFVVDPSFSWGSYYPYPVLLVFAKQWASLTLIAAFITAVFWLKVSFLRSDNRFNILWYLHIVIVSLLLLVAELVTILLSVFLNVSIYDTKLGRVICVSVSLILIAIFFVISGGKRRSVSFYLCCSDSY
jgi:hypothetical protein